MWRFLYDIDIDWYHLYIEHASKYKHTCAYNIYIGYIGSTAVYMTYRDSLLDEAYNALRTYNPHIWTRKLM